VARDTGRVGRGRGTGAHVKRLAACEPTKRLQTHTCKQASTNQQQKHNERHKRSKTDKAPRTCAAALRPFRRPWCGGLCHQKGSRAPRSSGRGEGARQGNGLIFGRAQCCFGNNKRQLRRRGPGPVCGRPKGRQSGRGARAVRGRAWAPGGAAGPAKGHVGPLKAYHCAALTRMRGGSRGRSSSSTYWGVAWALPASPGGLKRPCPHSNGAAQHWHGVTCRHRESPAHLVVVEFDHVVDCVTRHAAKYGVALVEPLAPGGMDAGGGAAFSGPGLARRAAAC
jgi:hypothetical protein